MLVRMYAAKERETLVIETAHILSFGLFLCSQAFEKVSVDTGCKRKLTQNSFMQTGLTIGKGADIFALVSRGHRSDRIRENREAVKRDNNNIFDFMESEGYIRRKADASISSKDFYEIYRMWCEENSIAPLKARSFSDAMIANARKFNLEHCNNITNSAGRRVWGFMGVEAIARPHINGFYGDSPCTYVPEDIPEEWRQVE